MAEARWWPTGRGGIGIANYDDIKPGDVIEFFTTEKVKETLA